IWLSDLWFAISAKSSFIEKLAQCGMSGNPATSMLLLIIRGEIYATSACHMHVDDFRVGR
ncbi:hypothetical protein, partial [Acetomicrobium sp. S15 = DSM 107314]|uniref:hypothetical protein n=1 Tax=Acetomicrobium sp. S15 = DSM 107314 TaxID=2529858 RepID=UPI001E2E90DC